jgi:hypothetical protein
MPVYEVTTENGVYEVTTEGESMDMPAAQETPSIYNDPIGALTSADWWLTRPSGEQISAEQAVVAPASRVLDTLTFGLGDEISAGGASLFGGGSYEDELANVRGLQQNFSEASPVADLGLGVAAALKNPLVMASKVGQTVGTLPKVWQAIKEGARVGAAFGFNEGEGGLVNRTTDALTSGAIGGAVSGGLTGATQGGASLAKRYSSQLTDAADETLEKGLGVQYGDRVKGLNKVNLYVDDAGNTIPYDQLDDAAGIQAPIQKQIQSLKDAGILDDAPNDIQGLKLHITKEGNRLGKTIPQLVKEADRAIGKKEILPDFASTSQMIQKYRPAKQVELAKQFNSIVDDYIESPGSGLSKLTRFTDQLQKETNFDTAVPKEITELKRMMSFDLRKAAEREFDSAVPDLAGQFAKVNELVAATKTVGQTLNKPLSRQAPSFGDFIAGGSKPVTAVAAAASPVIGLPAAGLLAGAPILKNAALKYGEAAYPISMSKAYGAASKGANSLSDFLRGLPTGEAGRVAAAALGSLPQDSADTTQGFSDSQSLNVGTNGNRSSDKQRTQQKLSEEKLPSQNDKTTQAANQDDFSGLLGLEGNSPSLFGKTNSLFDMGEEVAINPIVSKFEGGQKLTAYEPPAKGSGVTVATGIDLGQRSTKELADLGLSEALIKKVQPYLGKKDEEAKKLLKSQPLKLTQDEADQLDGAVGQKISNEISDNYFKATGQELSELPEEARTVIESLAYNFGANLEDKLPTLWRHVINNDWAKVQDFLLNTKWKQPELTSRRKQEAALLSPLLEGKANV